MGKDFNPFGLTTQREIRMMSSLLDWLFSRNQGGPLMHMYCKAVALEKH
jgi:hypothetical protein